MRLPSMQYVTDSAKKTFLRFPLVLIVTVLAAGLAMWMVGQDRAGEELTKLLLTLTLGIPLQLSLALVQERRPPKQPFLDLLPSLLGVLALCGLYWHLSTASGPRYQVRYAQWLVPTLVLPLFAAYVGRTEITGIWQFNRRLMMRGALSTFYAVVFFSGLSIALGAIDALLGVRIAGGTYARLWIFSAYVLFPWHFLAGVPHEWAALEADSSYPKGLRVFTQYMLIPLATVYFLILYVYMGKILVTQQWPQGWISWLTTTASSLGLLTFLLLFPIRDQQEHRWIGKYSRGFCWAALPLLGMLGVAIYKRVAQYGVTENRYYLTGLSLWLLGIFLYFLLGKVQDIRWVPMSLFLVAVLSNVGPWGAGPVSLRSQMSRLQTLLQKNGLLREGRVVKAEKAVSLDDRKDLSASLSYVTGYHDGRLLQKWFMTDLSKGESRSNDHPTFSHDLAKKLMEEMGLRYVTWGGREEPKGHRISVNAGTGAMNIRGYSRALSFFVRPTCPQEGYGVSLTGSAGSLTVCKDGHEVLALPLEAMIEKLNEVDPDDLKRAIPQDLMVVEGENERMRAKVYFDRMMGYWQREEGAFVLESASGTLLLRESP